MEDYKTENRTWIILALFCFLMMGLYLCSSAQRVEYEEIESIFNTQNQIIMGCDIHFHSEVKVNGKWEHYKEENIDRCYPLFAKMAGVRNGYGYEPISEPKGLPEDVSLVSTLEYKQMEGDAHSASYLTSKEVFKLCQWIRENDFPRLSEEDFGWFFGYFYTDFFSEEKYYPQEIEDFRFVFWFDN